ncbi:hypothetical protein [Phaeodactylibacter xiamenensis]|uniref:hypothetical protein n=1 Tax=Phaeodactylibacter xiamenensis TaxID=1524460 RepID=UPI0024A8FDDA|nr:hypothetical protein [Phaeodactylibacter xiamenensis]
MNLSRFQDYGISDAGQFIAIYEDNTYEKFPLKQMAKRQYPLYIGEHTIAGTFHVSTDPERPKFSFNIYDENLEKTTIKINGWNCSKFMHWYYNGEWVRELTLLDPIGEPRTIRLSDKFRTNERDLEAITHLIEDIKDFSWLKCWESYDLFQDNTKLRKKVKALKLKIRELKSAN